MLTVCVVDDGSSEEGANLRKAVDFLQLPPHKVHIDFVYSNDSYSALDEGKPLS